MSHPAARVLRVLAVVLLTSVALGVPARPGAAAGSATASLNLRAEPGVAADVLVVVPDVGVVAPTGRAARGFLEVAFGGSVGWVYAAYLQGDGLPNAGLPTASTTDGLNLRAGPGTDEAILDVVASGQRVGLTGASANGFRSVSHDRLDGWMARAYLDLGASSAVLAWKDEIRGASAWTGVPPELLAAVIDLESGGDAEAVSPAGALGLMQLMPWWFDRLGVDLERWREPDVNVELGATILAGLYDAEGSWEGALADYFGPGCDAYGTCTADYVAAVMDRMDMYAQAF